MLARLTEFSSIVHKRVPLWVRASSTTYRTADPAVHASDPDGIDADGAAKAAVAEKEQNQKPNTNLQPEQLLKPTPYASALTIESSAVHQPLDPVMQQRRRNHQIKDVNCVGVDDGPLAMDGDDEKRRQEEEEDRAYYKEHKASPLSHIEIADTRKPITQVTDSYASSSGVDVIDWKEEQLDTDEEALMRAMRIWRESAMRGVPDYPHSRALRAALLARGDTRVV